MHALMSQIEDDSSTAIQIRERNMGELQDAVSRYLPLFYRRAYRYLGNPHDAEDAVQDALLSAYKHLDQFKGNAKMTTWLTSIVTNSALTHLRKRPRQANLSLDQPLTDEKDHFMSDRLADVRPSPEDECAKSELRGHLRQIVGELSPLYRKAIQLCDFDEMTMSEAAHTLGVPESTVKTRVSRARARLKLHVTRDPKRTTLLVNVGRAEMDYDFER
jgi:RNA polymerase sigma-70 factor (ECF subfamily)